MNNSCPNRGGKPRFIWVYKYPANLYLRYLTFLMKSVSKVHMLRSLTLFRENVDRVAPISTQNETFEFLSVTKNKQESAQANGVVRLCRCGFVFLERGRPQNDVAKRMGHRNVCKLDRRNPCDSNTWD